MSRTHTNVRVLGTADTGAHASHCLTSSERKVGPHLPEPKAQRPQHPNAESPKPKTEKANSPPQLGLADLGLGGEVDDLVVGPEELEVDGHEGVVLVLAAARDPARLAVQHALLLQIPHDPVQVARGRDEPGALPPCLSAPDVLLQRLVHLHLHAVVRVASADAQPQEQRGHVVVVEHAVHEQLSTLVRRVLVRVDFHPELLGVRGEDRLHFPIQLRERRARCWLAPAAQDEGVGHGAVLSGDGEEALVLAREHPLHVQLRVRRVPERLLAPHHLQQHPPER
eukprot:2030147-Rhodomonas_salina.1